MNVEIKPYTPDLEESVRAFNERLRNARLQYSHFPETHSFPETHVPRFPKLPGKHLYQQLFVFLHAGEVHGGYLLTHNLFAVRGRLASVAAGPQNNLSEGIVNPSYAMVGVFQMQDAQNRYPLMYALGMGGMHAPLSELLKAMGWTLYRIPFYFRVLNVSRFFSNITYLRKHPAACLLMDGVGQSLLASLLVKLAQARVSKVNRSVSVETFAEFGPWTDALWDICKNKYSLVGLRDAPTLNALYPSNSRFLRVRVSRNREDLGWVVMLDTRMSGHKQLGSMRVGSIVDCLAHPDHAYIVSDSASRFLEGRGVDVIVSNQASLVWGKALKAAGYLKGPSNFILGLSPALVSKLQPFEILKETIHMNRGDGDGPIHL